MGTVPESFYRVSIKALILDESRTKFLIIQEDNGKWDIPGGGLKFGASPQEDLPREIDEEMGVKATWVADNPCYFSTAQNIKRDIWIVNVFYETTVENLDFSASKECVDFKFVDLEDANKLEILGNTLIFAKMFDYKNHIK